MKHLAAFLAISFRCWYSSLIPEEEMEGYQYAMAKPTLLPDPTCLHLQLLDASEATITAVVTTTSEEAECPRCASTFSSYSLALCALGRRSALDGVRCAFGTADAPLFLPQPGMCAPDL